MTAGPKDLAGLMLHPSIGSNKRCATKTAKPIAIDALFPAVDVSDAAVSQITAGNAKGSA